MRRIPCLMSAAVLALCACAGPAKQDDTQDHAAHHPSGPGADPAAAKADQQMSLMREMHRKMQAAKTPQERTALMDEHMKAMQGGMSMMCDMGAGMGAKGGAAPKEAMARCMEMKDMTMQMMMERESGKAPAPR
jgi:hypothetical protein